MGVAVDRPFAFEIADVFTDEGLALVREDPMGDDVGKLRTADPFVTGVFTFGDDDIDDLKGSSNTLIVGEGKAAGVG